MSGETTRDDSVRGLVAARPDPMRYDYDEPAYMKGEVTGLVIDRIKPGSRVIDVGCATGGMTLLIASSCDADIIGVEPDKERVERARSRGLVVHEGILDADSHLTLGRFDVVLFIDVIEHVVSPVSLLEDAARLLAPGGVIMASVPNVAHWTIRAALLRGRFDYTHTGIMDATHVRWYTAQTLDRVFEEAGLQIVEHTYSQGAWLGAYRRLPRRGRRRLLQTLLRCWPRAWGCQHFVVAKIPST